MRQRTWHLAFLVFTLVAVAAWRQTPSAQARDADVLGALLTEVRGLRAAMEQMASAGPRIQLATARLQLQEQRVNSLVRRLDDVRANARNAAEELSNAQLQHRQIEQAIASAENRPGDTAAEEAKLHLKALREATARREADLLRLQTEEAQISQDIAVEQARWTEINNRLDELDRALTRK